MPNRRLRIAFFCHNYPPHIGGLEVVVQELARRLARQHQVVVVTSASHGSVGRSIEEDVVVWRLPVVRPIDRFGVPYPVPIGRHLQSAIADAHNADILHAHGCLYPTSILASYLSRTRGTPLVLTEHVGVVPYRSRVLKSVQKAAWSTIAPFVVKSARVVQALNVRVQTMLEERFPGAHVVRTSNGVDETVFRPLDHEARQALRSSFALPPGVPAVLMVARESEKKNVPAILSISRSTFVLIACGANRNLSGPNIVNLGVVSHKRMPEVYASADVLVHAAEGEGFPVAVQEAMACGLPVVLRKDSGYGTAVPRHALYECDPGQEEAAVRALLGNAMRRNELAAAARRYAETHWSWDAVVSAHEDVYLRIMEPSRG